MADTLTWTPHLRLSWGGILGTGQDVWTNAVRFHCQGFEPTRAQLVDANALVAPLVGSWLTRADSWITPVAALSWTKLNWITAAGKQRDIETVMQEVTPIIRGAGGGQQSLPPWYQTQAITLRTRQKRGRGHSGRVFPPAVSYVPSNSNDPYTSAAAAAAQASSFITLLRAVRSAMATGFNIGGGGVPDPAVFSPGSQLRGTQPLWVPIIAAVVDRVPDVQHRRTNRVLRLEGDTTILDP